MNEYTAVSTIKLFSGKVALDYNQADAREHAVEKTDIPGIYEIKSEIHFKAGEQFFYDGELPKALASLAVVIAEEVPVEVVVEKVAKAITKKPHGKKTAAKLAAHNAK